MRLSIAHADGDLLHVGAQRLADCGDLVDEADLGGQESIGCVFDHLGRAQVGHDDAGAQRQMQLRDLFGRNRAVAAQHDPVRIHEVIEGRALAGELGATDHVEFHRLFLVAGDDVGHPVACPHRHGALVDHDQGLMHGLGDGLSRHAHILEVGLSVHAGGRAHADENELGVSQRLIIASGKGETPGVDVAQDHLVQSRLIDGRFALAQHLDLLFADVEQGDPVAQVGKASACGKAHVAGPGYRNILHNSHYSLLQSSSNAP